MVRPPFVDSNGMRKGAWSEEEDNKLRAYIQRYGHWNWRLLPKYAGLSRCGKSCRLRWVNYLKPGVKKGNFTNEEEDLIIELHMQLGNKWSAIAAKLPGRTDNEIKNFWHTRVEKRLKRNPPAKKNDVGHTTIEASSKDEEFDEDDNKFSKNTLCETAQNESAAYLDWPTSSFDNNPSVLQITEPGPVDSWPDTFLPDTAYSPISDYFPPLREEDFFYPEFHYNDLSSSDSSYNNLTGFDWINGADDDHSIISSDNYVAQTDLWSESFAANASSSQSESSYNIPSQEVGAGAYDPFFHEYFDHGMNLFS